MSSRTELIKIIPAFTQEDVQTYAHISGDHSLIHTDHAAALDAGFQGVVVHGMFAAATVENEISGLFTPPPFVTASSCSFQSPVYTGCDLELSIKIQQTTQGVTCTYVLNEVEGETVIRGKVDLQTPAGSIRLSQGDDWHA
ncbi:acyl dehydratase [Salsuginibacillus halophilus]|uniref:Acyl dehydratase n=1 Tax=Salsuginibacillus halophilus TaxID=517424 RepID=A0A2P8HKX8_9BACI|nr:MaoC/PaaZ C-terminal domain-containing protein [Salsuginibacillus halophilus]PSL46862.1 acyl dehydratase [Salsuginibacillus halophilus]